MLKLPGYIVNEQIYENSRVRVYRGCTSKNRTPVVIKALKEDLHNPVEISSLKNGYEIGCNLDIEGVVKTLKIEQSELCFAVVMEDVGAVPLRKYIQNNPVDLTGFLNIAVQLAETLGRLHERGIIHRDLKPDNILIHPVSGKVYIIDLSGTMCFLDKNRNNRLFSNLVETPEYMSPEQSGELNLEIDQRSDLYSLGVLFYELITSRLPLQAESDAGWIYARITQKPQPPDKINTSIPAVVSDIIMKLLKKSPEERYQSAYGLLWDLNKCRKKLLQTGSIEFFNIGQVDAAASFQLPGKLFGREEEKEILESAFERVSEGLAETIMISGYPGIGKTMLVNECFQNATKGKGYFIAGKFDQLERNIPYAAFADAFSKLVKKLMTENKENLSRWKKRIVQAVGRNGAVITEIIPELEWMVGKRPPVDELPPKEAENRFMMVFRDFIKVLAWKGHPLVLFLDDLQWADYASLKLLDYLIRDESLKSLLIIGAYRDNEVRGNQPLEQMLEESRELLCRHDISLDPLKWDETAELVAETLHKDIESVTSLSKILYRKSAGNPFFLRQLLKMIREEGLLYFHAKEGWWKWDLDAIEQLEIGEEVLELLLKKLLKLPEETREILKHAACIGNRFDLETLAAVCAKSLEETVASLMPSIFEGLVLELEEQDAAYEFLHDRVHQAAYSLVAETEKKEKHYAIGRLLLQKTAPGNLDGKILAIMDHFNKGMELVVSTEEKMELAGYNLLAGRKAKVSAAYASALKCFRAGRVLLPAYAWELDYRLCYDIHLELAQMEYLVGNVETAEELFDMLISKAHNELERAGIYSLKIVLYAGIGKYQEAVQTGISALKKLGVKIPVNPKKLDYLRELLLYKWYMRNKKIEDLVELPEIESPIKKKIAELLTRLSSVTMTFNPDLYSFVILKTGNYAVMNGNTEMTSVGYFGYSITAGVIMGDYEAGERYGRVCIQLVEKYNRSYSKCIIYFVYGSLISHWTKHAKVGLEYLEKAAVIGVEAGDVLIIGYAHCLLLENSYLTGVPLDKIKTEIQKKDNIARRIKHDNLSNNVAIYTKMVSALQGERIKSLASSAGMFKEDGLYEIVQSDQASVVTFHFCEMKLHYLAGNYKEALSAAQKIEPMLGAILGFLIHAEYNFYYSLVIAALIPGITFKERRQCWKKLKKNQKQMKKWAESCRENFEHKYLLVAAEIARLQRRNEEAMSLYDRAVQSARESGYIQNEALANELAARFYLQLGHKKIARTYLVEAFDGYNKWGAFAKAEELGSRYTKIIDSAVFQKKTSEVTKGAESAITVSASQIETAAGEEMSFIKKTMEKISGETEINKLFDSFLEMAVQVTAADRCCLIFEKDGELYIEAIKGDSFTGRVRKSIPLEKYDGISKHIVRYVARTLEDVVLDCGDQAGIFSDDPYIARSYPKSIACFPLLFQGIPFGVLYFENNSMPSGVFKQERLELLKLLLTQLAYVKKLHSYLREDFAITGSRGLNQQPLEHLTDREAEVLTLIAAGLSNKEISERLEMTINTVKTHIKNIYGKLKVNRRIQAVEKAKRLKIL